ncbi:MAG TPA: hypothetical protein DCQ99_02160 [Nitrospinae bacterium]|nr:hypothetical protein [Nitrospinota bacterium]HBA27493.1 hypothetical protein [Nitrospinota bacterium]
MGKINLNFYTIVLGITLLIMLINLPFGYIRSKSTNLSRKKGRCIYIPILISIALRKILFLNYNVIPFMVAGTIAGQFFGGKIKKIKT